MWDCVPCNCRLQSVKDDIKIGARRPWNNFTQQSIDFMDKVLDISGLSDRTFLPDGERLIGRFLFQKPTSSHAHSAAVCRMLGLTLQAAVVW